MSDSETNPMNDLLSTFALGPAWARATGAQQQGASKPDFKSKERPSRSDERGNDDRKGGFRDRDQGRDRDGGRKPFVKGRGGKFDDRRSAPSGPQEAPPADGVRVTLSPDPQAVHLIGKEIHQVARAYPLFDVAKILLAERSRCRAVFEAPLPHPPLIRGKIDDSLFLTREEAVQHLWQSELRGQFIEEETIEVDPPTGNFLLVARCGISGEWLGPPNFHSYQVNLRRLHRERFSSTPFAFYSSMVRTERGEEAVNAWLETMKKKTRWRITSDGDDAWMDDRTEAERALASRCFDQAFEETRYVEVLASIPPKNLSPSLLTSMKLAGNHARNHPAILIPAVCRAVEAEHLPVFKRLGKLFTGPARPHPLPPNAVLAERPGIMVSWIRANKPAKLEGLWKAVLPEGGTAPPAEFAADLFWLLQQGHILLFTDDTLVVQDARETAASENDGEAKPAKRKKKKSKKAKTPGSEKPGETAGETPDESPSDDDDSAADPSDDSAADSSDESQDEAAVDPTDDAGVPRAEESADESPIEAPAPTPEPQPAEESPVASAPEAPEPTPEPEIQKIPSPVVDESASL